MFAYDPKYVNNIAVYDYKPSEKAGTMEGLYSYNATMDVQCPLATASVTQPLNTRICRLP